MDTNICPLTHKRPDPFSSGVSHWFTLWVVEWFWFSSCTQRQMTGALIYGRVNHFSIQRRRRHVKTTTQLCVVLRRLSASVEEVSHEYANKGPYSGITAETTRCGLTPLLNNWKGLQSISGVQQVHFIMVDFTTVSLHVFTLLFL